MSSNPGLQQAHATPVSWWPMAAIALGQAQMSWNINALPVSVGAISAEFGTAPTLVVTAIVAHSLGVAGFTMLGARLGRRIGSLRVYRAMTVVFLVAMVLATTSTSPAVLIGAQLLAGLAAAAILPALVVLTAQHYQGRQRATALGVLGAVQAIATVVAFFIAGVVGTFLGWRYSFGLLIPFSIVALLMSWRLDPVAPAPEVGLDRVGALLAAAAVILLSLGFDKLEDWGWLLSEPGAPVNLLGLSPAPIMILCGLLGVQFFIAWTQRREARGEAPLLALSVIESKPERAAVVAMMAMSMLGKSITFLIPLYMQIIQGSNSLQTAVAMIPYQLTVMAAAILVVQLYLRLSPRRIARHAFAVVIMGTLLLALTVSNDWSNLYVVAGLMLVGLGQGALSTLLFNVLVSASPTALAGDVGALRGTVGHLASAVGTAVTGAFVVAVLAANIQRAVLDHPAIPPGLISQVPLDNVTFVSNDQLRTVMSRTTATPQQVEAALEINADARLRAMKLTFLLLTGLGLLALVPAGRLPNYRREDGPTGTAAA
jgi:MFS family permease